MTGTISEVVAWALTDEIYYNGSTSYQFSLSNKSTIEINITGLFEYRDSEKNFTINISAEPYEPEKTATPPRRMTINVTMNSYTGGPYFIFLHHFSL